MTIKAILVGLSCLLLLNPAMLGQKTVKGPHASTTTQKNADGTVTKSTTTYADGVNVKTTTGKNGTVDDVITEPDVTYGTAGTKVTVKSYQNKPQPAGPPIKDWKTLVEYKEKSGLVRHQEFRYEFSSPRYSIDYGKDGKVTEFVETGQIFVRIKHDYDRLGRPLKTSIDRRIGPDEPLEKYRITYKYNGDDDKEGTPTVEKYDEASETWEATKEIDADYAKSREKSTSGEISRLISSTERIPDLTADLSPGALPDVGETSKQKEEPPKPKTPSTPSTRQDIKPRHGSPPRKVATGPTRRATPADRPRTATGQGTAAGAIDPCLVGVWHSELFRDYLFPKEQQGLSGIVLTIRVDGMIAIDYNGMQPVPWPIGPDFTYSWAGTASGHVSSEVNEFGFVTEEKSDVTETSTDHSTGEVKRRNLHTGFVPLGPAGPNDHGIKCDATTLRYHNINGDFTFKRFGTALH